MSDPDSSEEEHNVSLGFLLDEAQSSRQSTRRPGRQPGDTQRPYTTGDYDAAFKCFMEVCPASASGAHFLKKLQQRMPSWRTISALQTFVSEKLRKKMAELVREHYGKDLTRLTLSQSLALRQFMKGGIPKRCSKRPNQASRPMLAYRHLDVYVKKPLALPWKETEDKEVKSSKQEHPPPASDDKEDQLTTTKTNENVLPKSSPGQISGPFNTETPPVPPKVEDWMKAVVQQACFEFLASATRDSSTKTRDASAVCDGSFKTPLASAAQDGSSEAHDASPEWGGIFNPVLASTPTKSASTPQLQISYPVKETAPTVHERKHNDEPDVQITEEDTAEEMDTNLVSELDNILSNSVYEETDEQVQSGSSDNLLSFMNSGIGARISNITVIELFSTTGKKKRSQRQSPFLVKEYDGTIEICHCSQVGKRDWSTEVNTGHNSELADATADVSSLDITSKGIDLSSFTVVTDKEKEHSHEVGHMKGQDGEEYPVLIVRRK